MDEHTVQGHGWYLRIRGFNLLMGIDEVGHGHGLGPVLQAREGLGEEGLLAILQALQTL